MKRRVALVGGGNGGSFSRAITNKLAKVGLVVEWHYANDAPAALHPDCQGVIVQREACSHPLSEQARDMAKARGVPYAASLTAWSHMYPLLVQTGFLDPVAEPVAVAIEPAGPPPPDWVRAQLDRAEQAATNASPPETSTTREPEESPMPAAPMPRPAPAVPPTVIRRAATPPAPVAPAPKPEPVVDRVPTAEELARKRAEHDVLVAMETWSGWPEEAKASATAWLTHFDRARDAAGKPPADFARHLNQISGSRRVQGAIMLTAAPGMSKASAEEAYVRLFRVKPGTVLTEVAPILEYAWRDGRPDARHRRAEAAVAPPASAPVRPAAPTPPPVNVTTADAEDVALSLAKGALDDGASATLTITRRGDRFEYGLVVRGVPVRIG